MNITKHERGVTVDAQPERVSVTLPASHDPSSLTLRASVEDGSEYTQTIARTGPGAYTIDLTDALKSVQVVEDGKLENRERAFAGEFEVLFPEELAAKTFDYSVEFASGTEKASVKLKKPKEQVEAVEKE